MRRNFIGCKIYIEMFYRYLPVLIYFGVFAFLILKLNIKLLRYFSMSFIGYTAVLAILASVEFIIFIADEHDDDGLICLFAIKFIVFNGIQLWVL
jgi:hypothetical protein